MEPTKEPNIVKWIDIILDFLLGKNRESKEYYNTYCSCSGKELYLVILDNIFRLAISGIGVGVLAYLFCLLLGLGGSGDIVFFWCFIFSLAFAFVLAMLEYIRN